MIVPVRRWAVATLFAFSRPKVERHEVRAPKARGPKGPGMLESIERLMQVQVDHILRDLD